MNVLAKLTAMGVLYCMISLMSGCASSSLVISDLEKKKIIKTKN